MFIAQIYWWVGAFFSFFPLIVLVVFLQALNWHLSPMTLNSWIQLYLQIAASRERASQQATSKSSPSPCTMLAKSPCDLDTSANSPCDLDTSASSASDPDTVAHSHHEHLISSCSPCDLDTLVPSSSRDLDISAYSACTLDTSRNSGVSELVVCASGMDLAGAAHAEDDGDGGDEEYEPSAEDGGSETDSGDDMDVTEEQKAMVEQNIVHPFYSPHVYLQVSQVCRNSQQVYLGFDLSRLGHNYMCCCFFFSAAGWFCFTENLKQHSVNPLFFLSFSPHCLYLLNCAAAALCQLQLHLFFDSSEIDWIFSKVMNHYQCVTIFPHLFCLWPRHRGPLSSRTSHACMLPAVFRDCASFVVALLMACTNPSVGVLSYLRSNNGRIQNSHFYVIPTVCQTQKSESFREMICHFKDLERQWRMNS